MDAPDVQNQEGIDLSHFLDPKWKHKEGRAHILEAGSGFQQVWSRLEHWWGMTSRETGSTILGQEAEGSRVSAEWARLACLGSLGRAWFHHWAIPGTYARALTPTVQWLLKEQKG